MYSQLKIDSNFAFATIYYLVHCVTLEKRPKHIQSRHKSQEATQPMVHIILFARNPAVLART